MDKVSLGSTGDTPNKTGQNSPIREGVLSNLEHQNPTLQLSYRAQLILKAFPQIPFTAEGLPVGYYRTDLLPNQAPEDAKEEMQALKVSYADLNFEHGYPTLHDSRPFWHKLDFEPGFAYGIFQTYLEQLNQGPREISKLANDQEVLAIASRMQGLPEGQLIPRAQLMRLINEFAVLYYWRVRAKAHDLYQEAAYRHLRLRRQMSVEDNHFNLSETLLQKLKKEVFEAGESFWAEISPKVAVDMLKGLVAIQRISTGLPAAGPLSQKETPENTTFEMIMRSLGQKAAQGNVYENGQTHQGGRELLDSVLKDKDAAANFQEVIIRVTQAAKQQYELPNPHEGAAARRFKGRPNGKGNGHAGNGNSSDKPVTITADDLAPFDISGAPGENLDNGASDVDSNDVGDDGDASSGSTKDNK